MESQIKSNAELVRKVAREKLGISVDYDEQGVRWLDGYINRQRESATEETKDSLTSTLGSYLGECIRHTYGGEWIHDPELGWTVRIDEGFSALPFNKVSKQLTNEDGDSVLGFFTAIGPMLERRSANAAMRENVVRRRWWKFW